MTDYIAIWKILNWLDGRGIIITDENLVDESLESCGIKPNLLLKHKCNDSCCESEGL